MSVLGTHQCPSSSKIRCMHIEGRIPFKSASDHPSACLCSRRTLNNFSSSSAVKDVEIVTGSVDYTPRYAYFKWLGRGFCSILGGCSTDGTGVLAPSPRDSKYFLLLCPKESIHLTYSSASSLRFSDSFSTRLVSKGSVRPLRLDTIASTISAMKQVSLSAGCLTASNTLNFTSSYFTLNFSFPL